MQSLAEYITFLLLVTKQRVHFWLIRSFFSLSFELSSFIFLLHKWVRSEVAQSCLTLCDPMDCSLPGSCVHGIFQARVLEWVALSFFRGSSWPRDQTLVSCIAGRHFTVWATREASELTCSQMTNEKYWLKVNIKLLLHIL